jgi:hypothetical protein
MQTGQNSIAPDNSLPQLGQVRWASVLIVLTALQGDLSRQRDHAPKRCEIGQHGSWQTIVPFHKQCLYTTASNPISETEFLPLDIAVSEDPQRFTSAEIFDPETGNWSQTGSMNVGRSEIEYAAVRLPDGRVLVPGGDSAPHTETNTADLFNPETGTWAPEPA